MAWESEGRREAGGGAERVGPSSDCRDAASLETGGWQPVPSFQPRTLMLCNSLLLSGYRSGIFLALSVLRARDLPSEAMSEGVDLIDIYADEEFNQVRSPQEQWDFPVPAEESLAANLQGSQALSVVEDLLGLNTRLSDLKSSL